MAAYAGVRTTGIYCRPECGGRPNPENVGGFALAASAEAAGYRACFQCRPYREAPALDFDAPELVCRAVRLILGGALDGAGEDALGAQLGVSPRHLRRLFTQHLGVTPDGLARSARAHFARRLLDDTDLTVTQIAFSTGFGSVRQFNRACREIFRDSPRNLRARRRKGDRLVADGGLSLRLPFRGELHWEATLARLAAEALPGIESVDAGAYRRTIVVEGDPGVLELLPGDARNLVLRLHLPHWRSLMHLAARARKLAGLDGEVAAWDPREDEIRAHVPRERLHAYVERNAYAIDGLEQLGLTHVFADEQLRAVA